MHGKTKSRTAPVRVPPAALPILAAGGIVVRRDLGDAARFAVVQSARKVDARGLHTWGLPKGKLAPGEAALAAARREVLEETGHAVTVHEFLGTLVYEQAGRRPKAVQFWRMETSGAPRRRPLRDVRAVDWLLLDDALDRLSHVRERVFLEQAGPLVLQTAVDGGVPLLLPAGAVHEPLPQPPVTTLEGPGARGKMLLGKTWRWFRDTATPQRRRAE